MGDGTDPLSGLVVASGALNCFSVQVQIAAYNIANVNTKAFKSSRVSLATGYQDLGVKVSEIKRNEGLNSGGKEEPEVSGTDLARELVHLTASKNSFIANAKVIGILEETSDSLLNIKA